jgi:hypothetical protein
MSKTVTALVSAFSKAKLSTEATAASFWVEPQTLRASLCRNGHYMGLRPVKLPNGRLLWDAAEVERLTAGEVA